MIYQSIETTLKSIAENVHSIIDTNQISEPKIGTAWVRATLIPGRSTTASLGESHYSEHQGLYRLDIFVDKGMGLDTANKLVDEFIVEYKANLVVEPDTTSDNGLMVYVGEVWREAARFEPVWVNVPVYVAWKAIVKNNTDPSYGW